MPSPNEKERLIGLLEQAWLESTSTINDSVERKIAEARTANSSEGSEVSESERTDITTLGGETEARERARAITDTVISELLEKIKTLEGVVVDVRNRVEALELVTGIASF